jgi:hypothetical protein
MTETAAALLLFITVLEVKHFICDYPLQTVYQLSHKGIYGHPGGLLHAGLHVIGTSTAFLVIRPGIAVGAAVLLGEFVAHYHIDWAKDNLMRSAHLVVTDSRYWLTIGIDQLLHHLTYLAIAAIVIATA